MTSVIITGGGMTGATLALALSRLSLGKLKVHLVEAHTPESSLHPGFDARAIALAHGSCQQLARIGIWQAIAASACVIRQVQITDRGHCGFSRINASDYQRQMAAFANAADIDQPIDGLGYVVELHNAGQRLFSLLRQAPGVTLHCPAQVTHISRTAPAVTVTLNSGETLCAPLLVAADGTLSPVARQCGIQWQQWHYQQQAVIATVATSLPHRHQAFECFTEQGPLALLPMPALPISPLPMPAAIPTSKAPPTSGNTSDSNSNRSSLVWCQSPQQALSAMSWSDQQFCHELQRAFGWRLGRIIHSGQRTSYPLSLSMAQQTISHRLALAGNAAQTLHPVAGQGFNLGLRDVISLAETLHQAAEARQDIGSYPVLAAWQQRRQPDRQATIALTNGLVHLFANHWQPLSLCRNLALTGLNVLTPLRDKLAYRALGWVDR